VSNVTLGGLILTNWTMSGFPLNDGEAVEKYVTSAIGLHKSNHEVLKKVMIDFFHFIIRFSRTASFVRVNSILILAV
jgi:hypothetical protein